MTRRAVVPREGGTEVVVDCDP